MTSYEDIDLRQHWFRYWFGAGWHQSTTWTKVYLSSKVFCAIRLIAISQEMCNILVDKINFKITLLKLPPHLPGGNPLNHNQPHTIETVVPRRIGWISVISVAWSLTFTSLGYPRAVKHWRSIIVPSHEYRRHLGSLVNTGLLAFYNSLHMACLSQNTDLISLIYSYGTALIYVS